MNVEYKTLKDLPCNDLYQLFLAVGWATVETTTKEMLDNFNIGFINFPQDRFGVYSPHLKAIASQPEIPDLNCNAS